MPACPALAQDRLPAPAYRQAGVGRGLAPADPMLTNSHPAEEPEALTYYQEHEIVYILRILSPPTLPAASGTRSRR